MNRNRTTLKAALAVALILCVMGLTSQASALNTSSSEYLGSYTPPEPASPADEVNYINTLIAQATGTTIVSGVTYVRTANDCDGGACPTAVAGGALKDDTSPSTTIDVTGFDYLIGKYDGPNGAGAVWYVGGLTGNQTIPQNLFGKDNSQYELSHWSLYNPGTTTVPEPGTLLLVGSGLVALGIWRRRR